MTVIYHDEMADLAALTGKRVGVIGYGSLGRPVALNLRDSGIPPLVGTRTESTRDRILEDGIDAAPVPLTVQRSDVLILLLPDEEMPAVYLQDISPHLRRGQMLLFSSAYNVTYRFIEPPPFVDVGLIAPRMSGPAVRESYERGGGFQSFVAVGQDASGQAWPVLLAVARAIGALRAGAIELSFERETELDLFMQQAVLPALYHLMTTAAALLLARGYPPEAAFTELYLSGEFAHFFQQVAQSGMLSTLRQNPLPHQYGTISRIDRFNDLKLERLMEVTLKEIESGDFSREWAKEYTDGLRRLRAFYRNQDGRDLWELEQQTLELLGRSTDQP